MKVEAKIIHPNAYNWHVYNGPSKSFTTRSGKHSVALEPGHRFGLREASSEPGTMRMIHPHTGKNVVFSLTRHMATRLTNNSRKSTKQNAKPGKPKNDKVLQNAAAQHHHELANIYRSLGEEKKANFHARQSARHKANV